MAKKQTILIAPLDWGLGHATRCIPIINHLLQSGFKVVIATYGKSKALLQKEFPHLLLIDLPGYNLSYSPYKRILPLKIIWQLPKIFLSILTERRQIEKIVEHHKIDLIISDNRYGLFTDKIPAVFITHQLHIAAPFKWAEFFIQKINYYFINKFSECWVPDYKEVSNIAGKLSHPEKFPAVSVKYIGPLSRFDQLKIEQIKYDFLIILSGPEPQRTLLENKLLTTFSQRKEENILLIRGKPESNEQIETTQHIKVLNHIDTTEMLKAIEQSEIVISRCGYTTIMEMLSIQKKTILIPTPGQTEQEYLAFHLTNQEWAFCCNQDDDFNKQISIAKRFKYKLYQHNSQKFKEIITIRVDTLLSK